VPVQSELKWSIRQVHLVMTQTFLKISLWASGEVLTST
jgi:hypothetical protein